MKSFVDNRFGSFGRSRMAMVFVAATLLLSPCIDQAVAATFTVDDAGDAGDANAGDSSCDDGTGSCTFRAALQEANALIGSDTIEFSVGTGVVTLTPASALPFVTAPVIIDGTTQPGFSGTPIIELDGTSAGGSAYGLLVEAGNSTIRGLVINRFNRSGIWLATKGNNLVETCYIGTDVSGSADLGNAREGIFVTSGSSGNTLGGAGVAGNVISGNNGWGILLDSADLNNVWGNLIGTNAAGTGGLGNGKEGIRVKVASNNQIGGAGVLRNVISGNGQEGLQILGEGSTANVVEGNYIGTDVTGSVALANLGGGVLINDVSGNRLGSGGVGNVISGNAGSGVEITGPSATANVVEGNYIGTDMTGAIALSNTGDGIFLSIGSSSNTIGGTGVAGNVISGNGGWGILLDSVTLNNVWGNLIGTNAAGTGGLGNANEGIRAKLSSFNQIGGAGGLGNVISGNGQEGVQILGAGSTANVVEGNYIGVDVTGSAALANNGVGLWINDVSGNRVGSVGAGNVISGNAASGLEITGPGATGNVVEANKIGTDDSGVVALANAANGVTVKEGSSGNSIGGAGAAGNVISGNNGWGILLDEVTSNNVWGNLIGIDAVGTGALGNKDEGIRVKLASFNQIGGAGGLRNVISGNGQEGVHILGAGSTGNVVEGNYIGVDTSGSAILANLGVGVRLNDVSGNRVGSGGAGNVISGNALSGVRLEGPNATANVVEGNYIGTDKTGGVALANVANGVTVISSASGNTIGGAGAAGNVISGNNGWGILLDEVTFNNVWGNLIGIDAVGTGALGNKDEGIRVKLASFNQIGGAGGLRNVISGNGQEGVNILGASSTGNVVEGNYIGVDTSGSAILANLGVGVRLDDVSGNRVGSGGAGNVISGNALSGVRLEGPNATGNVVEGNYIGTNATGSGALANVANGVTVISSASGNTIGGAGAAGNVISGNTGWGILLDEVTFNNVWGNLIGIDAVGTGALGNAGEGIRVKLASFNQIGGAGGLRNVISSNGQEGVHILGASSTGNVVEGNYIGVDTSGSAILANLGVGVRLDDVSGNRVGSGGAGNVISGNALSGVRLEGPNATGNVVEGNYIGTDKTGSVALANTYGVTIASSASGNTIGGAGAAGNVISGNTGWGILLDEVTSNNVWGNLVGLDAAGTSALGNVSEGVRLKLSSFNQIGGAGSLRNVISGNGQEGIQILGAGSTGNVVEGNYIGVDTTGSAILANLGVGVRLNDVGGNRVGSGGAGNVISGNALSGVRLEGPNATGNVVEGNYIGTDKTGLVALANEAAGVTVKSSASGNAIGGVGGAGLENTIAHNRLDGLFLESGSANAILSNLIYSNGGLGIDLGIDGVEPNDPGDGDTGANGLQNYPVLSGANSSGNTVSGDLNSTPATTFRVEIFRNSACDPSDFGEGEAFAAFVDVITDGSGDASFIVPILDAGVSPGEIFTATATDPASNTSEFSQCVAANDPPVLLAIGNQSVNEGDVEVVTVTATDADLTDPTLTATGLPVGGATFADLGGGIGELTLAPSFTDGGSYSGIVITAEDATDPSLTDEETIAISVNEVNRAPELLAIGNQSVNEDDVEVVTVTASDPDGDIPGLSAANLPGFASFADLGGGVGELTLAPTFSDGGSYADIVITATDPVLPNPTDSETIAISVNEVNQAPVLDPIGNQSVNEGDLELVTVTATDPDLTTPILTASNLPLSGFATFVDNLNGTGTLTLAPTFSDGGSYAGIVITASDGSLTDDETIAISVNLVNRAPVVASIGNQSVNEGDVEVVNVSATDPDGDIPTLSASNLPSFAIFTPLPGGGAGQLTLSPTFSDAGSYSGIVITATDPIAPNPTGSETIAISVNAVNLAPILNAIGNQSVNEGDVEVVAVSAIDPDGNPQPLLSAANLPSFATFADLGGGNGTLTLAPTFSDGGSYSGIVITAKDATDPTSLVTETIAISANEINPPPVLAAVGDQQLDEGAILDVAVSATDPDGTVPLLSAANLPVFASFTTGGGGTGNLHLEPGFQDAGVYPNVEIIATDALDPGLTTTELITITVNEALNLSVITGGHKVIIGKNANISGDILSGDGVKILKGKKKAPGEIDGSIVAEGNAAIHKDNHVSGDVTLGGELKVGKRVVIDGTVSEHAEVLPVVLPFIEFPVEGRGRNITIKKKKTLDLPPNDEDHPTYRRLRAGHHSTLILHSGVYNFSDRFVMKHHANLVFDLDAGEPVTINIKRGLHMGHHTEVVINNGDAADVLFNITGPGILNQESKQDEDDDDWEGEDDKHVKIKGTKRDRDRHRRLASRILHKSVFQGTIVSPRGKVRVGHHTAVKGALIAYKVRIHHHVEFSGVLANHLEFSGPPPAAKMIADWQEESWPEDFEFPPNYPNPFNPETTIPFAVPDVVYVSIEIFDILGQRVKTLVDREMNAGTYSVVWNGRDDAGRDVASGVYLYRIVAGEFAAKRRLLLVR